MNPSPANSVRLIADIFVSNRVLDSPNAPGAELESEVDILEAHLDDLILLNKQKTYVASDSTAPGTSNRSKRTPTKTIAAREVEIYATVLPTVGLCLNPRMELF